MMEKNFDLNIYYLVKHHHVFGTNPKCEWSRVTKLKNMQRKTQVKIIENMIETEHTEGLFLWAHFCKAGTSVRM